MFLNSFRETKINARFFFLKTYSIPNEMLNLLHKIINVWKLDIWDSWHHDLILIFISNLKNSSSLHESVV